MDVALEVVHADKRLVEAEREGFRVGDADEQRASETGTLGYGYGVEVGEGDWMSRGSGGAGHGFANHGNNVAEMFARGELRDDPAIVGMKGHLRGDDVGQRRSSRTDDRGCGLVTGAFDTQNQATLFERGHVPILMVTLQRYVRTPACTSSQTTLLGF